MNFKKFHCKLLDEKVAVCPLKIHYKKLCKHDFLCEIPKGYRWRKKI